MVVIKLIKLMLEYLKRVVAWMLLFWFLIFVVALFIAFVSWQLPTNIDWLGMRAMFASSLIVSTMLATV